MYLVFVNVQEWFDNFLYRGIEDSSFLLNKTVSTGKYSPVDTVLHPERLQDLNSEEFLLIEGCLMN